MNEEDDERRALVDLKREAEMAQNVIEETLHQLVRRIDARISAATGERRPYHPQPESWPARPPSFKR